VIRKSKYTESAIHPQTPRSPGWRRKKKQVKRHSHAKPSINENKKKKQRDIMWGEGIKQEESGVEGYRSEVLIEVKAVADDLLTLGVGLLLGAGHDTSLLIVTDTLLEEVGLASQGDGLHEVEGVRRVIVLLVAKGDEETVSHKLDVLAHELGVHAKQATGKSVSEELLLDTNGLDNDVLNDLGVRAVVQVREEETSEIRVETLVTRDELVGEGETGHQTTLLEPEDGGEGAREEDTLDSSEGNQTRSEGRLSVIDPADGPLSLLGNAGNWMMGQSKVHVGASG
jgi:hypothetical protein